MDFEFREEFIDQRLDAHRVQQPHEDGNDKDRGVDSHPFLPEVTGHGNGDREQNQLNAEFSEDVPGNISNELPEGGQKKLGLGEGPSENGLYVETRFLYRAI